MEIRAAEISAILKDQINNFGKSAPYKEIYNHFNLSSESLIKRIKEKL